MIVCSRVIAVFKERINLYLQQIKIHVILFKRFREKPEYAEMTSQLYLKIIKINLTFKETSKKTVVNIPIIITESGICETSDNTYLKLQMNFLAASSEVS